MAAPLEETYRRYLAACNAHAFDALDEFVADDVLVDGEPAGRTGYVAGLRAVVRAFPDYHWDLRHLLVVEPWVSAHFVDTGTHRGPHLGVAATGRRIVTQEFAVYRFAADRIVEVWVTADDLRVLRQLGGV